jgi:hypothetical protein
MVAGDLRFQKAGRKAVVAIKLDIIESRGDAIPAGHGSRLRSADMSHGGHDDVAEAKRFAYQHDFKLDRSASRQLTGTEKIDAGGADVAGYESDGKLLGHTAGSAKAKREIESGAGVFPMFWMNTHGVGGHADETPRLRRAQERRQAKRRDARRIGERKRSKCSLARFRSWFGRPRFNWSCAFCGAHQALRDGTSLSLATAQQTELPKMTFWNFPVHTRAVWSVKMALEVASVNLWKTAEVS